MFSFFRRGKPKEDSDKKDKTRDKSSFSPFTKKQDSVKKNNPSTSQEQASTLCDSRLSSGFTNIQVPVNKENHSSDCDGTIQQNTKPLQHSDSSNNSQSQKQQTHTTKFAKGEHDYTLPTSDLSSLAESNTLNGEEDSWRTDSSSSVVFERAGSSDRAESDSAFKTAPNTPVLPKHLTPVFSEVFIDSPDVTTESPTHLVSPTSKSLPETDRVANDPVQLAIETPKDVKKPLQIVLESLQEVKEPIQLWTDTRTELKEPIAVETAQLQLFHDPLVESTEIVNETNSSITESLPKVTESQQIVKEHCQILPEPAGPLGEYLDFPSADGEESSHIEPDTLESTPGFSVESEECSENEGQNQQEQGIVSQEEESDQCAKMSQSPGDLYDIAEEETSEEEDQSEEEREEDDDDDDDSGNVTQPTIEEEYPEEIFKKNLVNHEAQLELQERVTNLSARLSVREAESNKLLSQIDELEHDVMVKAGGMDRLQAELSAAHKESELVHKQLHKLEEDLQIFRGKNAELAEELQKRSGKINESEEEGFDFNRLLELEQEVKELTGRVKDLEIQLEQMRIERDTLEMKAKELAAEREEEKKIVQEALDEAMAEKNAIQIRFERDFEKLRTVNTDREQQLLDDFEWKLREVEQACKKRLDEKEKHTKQIIKAAEEKLEAVEEDLAQLESMKQFEAEATQLRGLNLEQQRALRFAERTKEQLQVSEKVLQEEVKKLKELLSKEKAALTTMQAIHNREIDEKDRKLKFRLEQQKNELNTQWEEKLTKETIRLKVELDQMYRDERRLTLEAARVEKEGELHKAKDKWEKRFQELVKEIDALKQKIADKEDEQKETIENVRTNADRDIFDLRRKLDRIDISYQEKIEKLQAGHEREKGRLIEESERKLQNCEQNWQMQLSSTRTTLELVKEQLKREAAEQIEYLHENHRSQLAEQWEQLTQERDEAIAAAEERHSENMEKLRAELEVAVKCRNSREQELTDAIGQMHDEMTSKSAQFENVTLQNEALQNSVQDLNQQIVIQDETLKQTQQEAQCKLRLMEESQRQVCLELSTKYNQDLSKWQSNTEQLQATVSQLTKQLEESKDTRLVEELRKALSDKEQQVAHLSKEKHLYQLELMNRNCHGETVTARQRRKGSRGKPGKPGPSRGQK